MSSKAEPNFVRANAGGRPPANAAGVSGQIIERSQVKILCFARRCMNRVVGVARAASTKVRVAVGVALGFGVAGSAMAQSGGFSDPAASIESALSGAASGASTVFIAFLTIAASALIAGTLFWAIRKGIRHK